MATKRKTKIGEEIKLEIFRILNTLQNTLKKQIQILMQTQIQIQIQILAQIQIQIQVCLSANPLHKSVGRVT